MNKNKSRRQFILKAVQLKLAYLFGAGLFSNKFQISLTKQGPEERQVTIPGKSSELIILNDRPINAETPPHLLDNDFTPNDLFFVRNNGIPPEDPNKEEWTISIEGEGANTPKYYTLRELKNKFENVTIPITLECGGNGRSEFNPPAKGNQWKVGAVGCAQWTGIRLRDVLNDVGIKENAIYVGYYGKDKHLSGDSAKEPISRGVPIAKALEKESLLAWSMNGEDLPLMNGYPLRLVFGGYPASASGKWIHKLVIRNQVHDGAKMGGQSYRVPCNPVAPGSKVADEDMCIIERMPVKSLITFPKTGATITQGKTLPIRGYSWTAAEKIEKVEVSSDFGQSWQQAKVFPSSNRYAWQKFTAEILFKEKGYFEVWARATDTDGLSQPMILPGWNPKGYLNNACHRIAVKVVKK